MTSHVTGSPRSLAARDQRQRRGRRDVREVQSRPWLVPDGLREHRERGGHGPGLGG